MSGYAVIYYPEIPNDIVKFPCNIKIRLKTAIENKILVDPVKFGAPLKRGLQGYRKLRVGDYRIIYKVEKKTIIVWKIGHRKEVYKKKREF